MTEEELFKVYIKRELCAHCRFPQLCQGEEDCSDIANAKRHYLAGVEVGKSMAETDLATIAYMQGAERYKPKWHNLQKNPNDLPKEKQEVLVYFTLPDKSKNDTMLAEFENNDFNFVDLQEVIAWCEVPTFTDKE